jgi:hypothetical protein
MLALALASGGQALASALALPALAAALGAGLFLARVDT